MRSVEPTPALWTSTSSDGIDSAAAATESWSVSSTANVVAPSSAASASSAVDGLPPRINVWVGASCWAICSPSPRLAPVINAVGTRPTVPAVTTDDLERRGQSRQCRINAWPGMDSPQRSCRHEPRICSAETIWAR
ncbi:Uncharacterised protein [Mycobacteroides abscessus subsp. abscessus]|nr:Uncharacterised protein [Mycobacteroides abscessus subsp. abscessus]